MNIHAHTRLRHYIYLIWEASASDEKNSCGKMSELFISKQILFWDSVLYCVFSSHISQHPLAWSVQQGFIAKGPAKCWRPWFAFSLILTEEKLKRQNAYPWAVKEIILGSALAPWDFQGSNYTTSCHSSWLQASAWELPKFFMVPPIGQSSEQVCSTAIISLWNNQATLPGSFYYYYYYYYYWPHAWHMEVFPTQDRIWAVPATYVTAAAKPGP